MPDRYYARSASDRTVDWPFWYVADQQRGGINVFGELAERHSVEGYRYGQVFTDRQNSERLAAVANAGT